MRLLFTGVGRRVELIQAFRNAALVLNKELKIFGADMAGTAPALAYCDFSRHVVSMKDPSYIDNLLQICADDSIDLLIPTIDTDLLILSENKRRFESIGTKVLISDPDKIRICRDKNLTSQFFLNCGLHAPMPVNNYMAYNLGFPAFIKPKDGSSSINAFKVENEDELSIYASQIGDYIVQPFITGREFTIDIFCDWDGNPITIVPRERLQVRAGEVLKTRIDMDDIMINEAKKLCKFFNPCGPMTVQLIRDEAGIDWFIEINPRFGGGAPLSMKAGARNAEALLKLLDYEGIDDYTVSDGSVYSRFDQSVCIAEGNGQIKGIIFDLDDTLYDENEYVRSGYDSVARYLGNEEYANQLLSFFEAGKPAVDELLRKLGRETEKSECLKIYRNHKPIIHLNDGVLEMLIELKRKKLMIGIITDGRPEGQRNKIEALELDRLIGRDNIIITDELGGIQFRKPCDVAFRILLTRWRLNPANVVYVGDNPEKDFQAPKQLGMRSIWYKNKCGLYQTQTEEESISTITDLITFL